MAITIWNLKKKKKRKENNFKILNMWSVLDIKQESILLPVHRARPVKLQEDQLALKWKSSIDLLVFGIFVKV